MARITKRKCKVCRRLGVSVCGREKCAARRRPNPPGMHGGKRQRRKDMGYGFQLREKQKVRFIYGLMERQFRNYVKHASSRAGDTGVLLKLSLERRLDNVVYRLGFTKTRTAARQLVTHGHVFVDGKKVDIPSYQLREGQVVSIQERKRDTKLFDTVREALASHETPGWLRLDPASWTGTVLGTPSEKEMNDLFDAKPIIEFYSR